jgi:hypothetical protein
VYGCHAHEGVADRARDEVQRLSRGYVDRHGRQADPTPFAGDRGELVERQHVVLDQVRVRFRRADREAVERPVVGASAVRVPVRYDEPAMRIGPSAT